MTHNVIEAEQVLDELVILDRGHVVASGTPASLRGTDGALRLELQLSPGAASPLEEQGQSPQQHHHSATPALPAPALRVVRTGRRLLVTIPAPAAAACVDWAAGLHESGDIETYALSPSTLEDAYLALTEASETDHDENEEITA